MALQFVTDISVDFYDKRYILINAKQYDKNSRFLAVTCYNHGNIFPLNAGEHAAYIRYKKPDNHSVFNFCEINNKGKIIVELTEQMLATEGIACADLVVVKKGDAKVNSNTGEIILVDNASVLSSMLLNINVSQPAIENSEIESTYEFNLLNVKLEEYWANFENVMKTSKSWAVGETGIRGGENVNNAKYYANQSSNKASAANTSALNAAESERVAGEHKDTAIAHSGNAYTYMTNAKNSMDSANTSATNAANSASAAKTSETNAKTSETNSKTSETNAVKSETNAQMSATSAANSATSANTSKTDANNYYMLSRSYAVGDTTARTGEEIDNAKYYYDQAKRIATGLNGVLLPMGTITFEQLSTATKQSGFMYNISNEFVSTSEFKDGGNYTYIAGTNVYWTADGYWDCLAGNSSVMATVSEVKDYLGI